MRIEVDQVRVESRQSRRRELARNLEFSPLSLCDASAEGAGYTFIHDTFADITCASATKLLKDCTQSQWEPVKPGRVHC